MSKVSDFLERIVRPVGKWVLIRKTARGEQIDGEYVDRGVVLPDIVWDNTNFVEIVDVGPECKLYTRDMVGAITWCPESPNSLNAAGCPSAFFWVKEEDLIPLLFDNNTITPIQDMVVAEIEESLESGGIHIATRRDLYETWGRVVAVGPKVVDLRIGHEVLIPEKSFTFLVGDRHLRCIKEGLIPAFRDSHIL